jgi:histidinol-phosphate aminotransferase
MRNWEKNIRKVIPYVPGEQPKQRGIIKLNTNENPYPPAPGVAKALQEMDTDLLRRYPDPAATALVEELANRYQLDADQVFVGVGSDDVLAMCFLTFFNGEKPILFPDITYSFYDVWADVFRIPYECQPLNENFEIVKEDYYKANGGVIFPNPNAPTGLCQDLEAVEDIIRHNQDVIVIVDEAYIDFGGRSARELIDRYDNLLVVQTFSKSRSLAGMRVGYAMGNKVLIKYLNDVKYSVNSYTMNAPTLAAAKEAVRDEAYFQETTGKIVATRERVKKELAELGFTFPDSTANFLFITHPKYAAMELFEALKIKKIYVRYFNKPRIDNYLRVTIGTDEEMDAFLNFLRRYMNV